MSILNLICAILLPPLGAFLQVGASKQLLINIILCLFFWFPGVLHAVWLVVTEKKV
jgi:uncharacterized membrane protein YqaE (UPF0057 family)